MFCNNPAYDYSGKCLCCEKMFMGYKRDQICHACEIQSCKDTIAKLSQALAIKDKQKVDADRLTARERGIKRITVVAFLLLAALYGADL